MKASWSNILESGTVTVTSAATGFDAYRLYDRLFGRMWKATSMANQTIWVDQGASPVAVDTLVIPAGHNLNGCTFAWERSSDNSSWNTIVTGWTQAGSAQIFKQAGAPVTYRYLRLVISGASAAAQAAECWMGLLATFPNPNYGSTQIGLDPAVERKLSPSKVAHYVRLGQSMKQIDCELTGIPSASRTSLESWLSAWDGSKPFLLIDHQDNPYFAEFSDQQPQISETDNGFSSVKMNLRQLYQVA